MFDSIVIGGGISGLTAAYRLSKAGKRVSLIEPHTMGGMVLTTHKEGFTLEHGPNVLAEKDHLSLLLNELGLRPQVISPVISKFRQLVWWHGAPTAVPRSPWAFLTTPLIPLKDKLLFLKNIFIGKVLAPTKDDESISTFFSRMLGEEGVRNIIDPALQGILGGNISKLSARAIFPELWSALKSGESLFGYVRSKKGGKRKVFVLQGGMEVLIRALADRLSDDVTKYDQKVRSVTWESGIFEVSLENGENILGKSLFLATSGNDTAEYVASLDEDLARALSGIRYAPLAVVHCSVAGDAPLPERSFGVLFPSGKAAKVLGVMFNSLLFPHTAPRGRHLLTVCVGGVDGVEICEQSDIGLQGIVREELLDKLSIKDPEFLSIVRWKKAIPQYEVGFSEIVKKLNDAEYKFPGLHFIGSEVGGVGVPDRVCRAWKAVEESL